MALPDALDSPLSAIKIFAASKEEADLKAAVVQQCAAMLLDRHPFLSFDALDCLVIAHDYRQAMGLYEDDGCVYDDRYMELAETTVGVVVPTQVGVALIIHPWVLQQMLSQAPEAKNQGFRIFMHELCHLHDVGLQRSWVRQHCRMDGVPNHIYKSCFSLWTEYFANRYSYFDGANLYDDWRGLERLLENFPQLDFPVAMEETVVRFAYALGSLAGLGCSLQDVRPDLGQRLQDRRLSTAWLEAERVTAQLSQTGECWVHAQGVMRLQTAVQLVIHACRYRQQ